MADFLERSFINRELLHEDWRLILVVSCFAMGCLIVLNTSIPHIPVTYWTLLSFISFISIVLSKVRFRTALICVAALFAGCATSQAKLDQLPENELNRQSFVSISGNVEQIEYRTGKPMRLTMRVGDIDKNEWLKGQRIRLSVRTKVPIAVESGDKISIRALLEPMRGKITPDGFDFALHNRLQGVAAQGFATSQVMLEQPAHVNSWRVKIQNIRNAIAVRVLSQVDQPLGGVAVALTTGQRQYIDNQTAANLRDAGLAHLLAISGLHMGLITGAAFFIFELLLAAVPAVSLRYQPRKVAAVIAWLFGLGYLALSGGSTSTIRAFIMVSIAILAVLTDRRVISLRSVSIAALVVLILSPSAISSVSFQMSFAATIGIVIAYDQFNRWRRERPKTTTWSVGKSGWRKATIRYFAAAASTSLIAQLAIAPIALYHFQAISVVGIIANVIAIPVMAFVVMPAALLALLLMSVGMDIPLFWVMQSGLGVIIQVAEYTANIPYSVLRAGPFHWPLMGISGACFLAAMLVRRTAAIAVSGAVILFSAAIFVRAPATILLDNGGRVIAVRQANGSITIAGGRRGGFRDEAWQRYWNVKPGTPTEKLANTCDGRACKYGSAAETKALHIVRSMSLDVTRRACNAGYIVIAPYTHERHCRSAVAFLSIEDIDRYGPAAVWLSYASDDQKKLRYKYINAVTER